jgi:hypothetical protein
MLTVIRRSGGSDTVVDHKELPATTGPVHLDVVAFDDVIRASVGDVVVEAARNDVREGRVAFVSTGAATFTKVLVDSLDMFYVDFVTSRYKSFADLVSSRDLTLYEHASDAMGAPAASSPVQALSTHGSDIATAMTESGNPQTRQELFARVLSDVGLAQLHRCDKLTVTRLTEAGGTTSLLLESPEPLSFIHDITLSLVRRTWRFVPDWSNWGEIDPIVMEALRLVHINDSTVVAPFSVGQTLASKEALIAHVRQEDPVSIDLYKLEAQAGGSVTGTRVSTVSSETAHTVGATPLVGQPAGTIAAIGADRVISGVVMSPTRTGSWVHDDVPIATTILSDGDETRALLLLSAPMTAGDYIMTMSFNRTRWETATPDADSSYSDSASINFTL